MVDICFVNFMTCVSEFFIEIGRLSGLQCLVLGWAWVGGCGGSMAG